jgi:hypothetical protein
MLRLVPTPCPAAASFVLAWTVGPLCIFMPTVDPRGPSTVAHVTGAFDADGHGVIKAMIGYVIEAYF